MFWLHVLLSTLKVKGVCTDGDGHEAFASSGSGEEVYLKESVINYKVLAIMF